MRTSGVIYVYRPKHRHSLNQKFGLALLALALGGLTGPMLPAIRLEANYAYNQIFSKPKEQSLPKSVPVLFDPLKIENGSIISPINTEFSLIVPKIGINAPVIPAVNPANPGEYLEALQKGVAHSSTSFFPDQNGTVYLFSHSTNYDWFVKDLNAVFYLIKNLEEGDLIVLFYKGNRYTYRLREKQVVSAKSVSYIAPQQGGKRLILQTCWPPGTTTERLLIFADLVEEYGTTI
ncbi:MAG: hypothetical protein ACD_36C00096G0004 [uncultured bacterium]|uniref:Sortase n=1 Tax=Candidatus Gottesmanbacteria bacterium RIFCSPLOWO2_01_FULL_43_11b TaxID=1798392 RepID=A0A1F6AHM5_9BACT|nr:MAG: hypothetical protein ACD_36C00096G0004 [uncultured bacterium]OGG23893.1 MAG: hypothetical protein A3A79_01695 [Candidatus Gottesmanbacteria bacterium RIFCSPLOWO2_01_FULL_43_11b]